MMRNLKIGTKILAIILIVSLLSLFFISAVSYTNMLNLTRYSTDANKRLGKNSSDSSKAALKSQAEEYIVKLAKEQALKSDAVLSKVEDEVASVAEYLTSLYKNKSNFGGRRLPLIPETAMGVTCSKYALSPGVAHTPTIDKELLLISNADYMVAPIFKHNPLLNNIYLGTTTGIFYFYSNYNSYDPNFDPRKRDWYKEAMENPGKSTWQDTYVDIYGTICVTNSRTFYDETGKPRGVVGADITLKSIQEDIIAMKIGETGYAFLLDNKGTIIAHPRYDEIDKEPLRSAKEDYRQAIVAITSHDEGLATAKIDGRQRYLAYYRLPTTKWSLVITVDVDEIIQPTVATQNKIDAYTRKTQAYINETLKDVLVQFIIILAIAALVILALSYLLAKTITNPIKLLLAKVAKIGEGDLETKIDDRGKDEIAELAAAFNKMTIDLKTYIANLSEITAEKERIGAELDVARKIQRSMLPCIFPPFPDREEFDLYATMHPAKEVGGDFYDFFLTDDDHLAIVIADVSGKGVPGALFMVIAKTLIKNNAQLGKSPKEIFETVNKQLCENNEASMFVTAFMGILEIDTGEFVYVNAGHNAPLLKKTAGDFQWLPTKPGFVLAGMEDMVYEQDRIILEPGDVLYLYTDGVTEAVNRDNELFGNSRLLAELNKYKDSTLTELLTGIKDEIDRFSAGAEQADDITMLALKIGRKKSAWKEIRLDAVVDNLDRVLDFVNSELNAHGCDLKVRTQINIAVEEIFVNIANYAYKPEIGEVTIRLAVDEEIVIEFEDRGMPYNPLETKEPDINKPAEEREIGGLGIFMVKKIMDGIEYKNVDNKNVLTLRKTVTGGRSS